MANEREIQFAVSLKNEASATIKEFQKDVESSLGAAGRKTEEYGQKVKTLTEWIKEERAEQRMHNFIFNQSREIVGGASSILALYGNTVGQTSESQRMLTNSMNAGFVAFQGVNNVVGLLSGTFKSLSGPMGLAISLASGIAVAFSQISNDADKAGSNIQVFDERIKQAQISIGTYTKAMQINDFEDKIAEAEAKLYSLGKSVIDFDATVRARAESGGKIQYVYKTIGTPAEIREQQAIIEESTASIKKLNDELQKGAQQPTTITKLNKEIDDSKSKFAELFRGQQQYELESTSSMQQNLMIQNQWSVRFAEIDLKNKKIKLQKELADARESLHLQIGLYSNFTNAVSSTYQSVLGEQFNKLLGDQNSVLEIFLGNVGQNLIAWSADQLSNTILNAIISQTTASASIAAISAEMAALTVTAAPAALAVNIASFGAAGAAAALSFGTAAASQLAAQGAVSFFHEGGTMAANGSRIPLQSDERHAILKVGETVLPTKPGESIGGTQIHNHFHFAGANIASPLAFKEVVEQGMRQLGMTDVTKYFVNQRNNLSIA